jgi:hypothetical protein
MRTYPLGRLGQAHHEGGNPRGRLIYQPDHGQIVVVGYPGPNGWTCWPVAARDPGRTGPCQLGASALAAAVTSLTSRDLGDPAVFLMLWTVRLHQAGLAHLTALVDAIARHATSDPAPPGTAICWRPSSALLARARLRPMALPATLRRFTDAGLLATGITAGQADHRLTLPDNQSTAA